jgi:ankyrin repeat protein
VNAANDRGWTPLHQAAYTNQLAIAERLLSGGADVDREAHGEGGTPLVVALFWGHREVADVLAAVAVVPNNLRVAAGLGRADLIEAAFLPDGSLTETARGSRGFYRPHSGFPVWQPSGDRQEVLDEALVWAAKCDRVDVLHLLVARGADVNGDPYRGTPLIWAASLGRLASARWLLDHGADVNRRATFGGPEHGNGVTALHLAAQYDRVEMARLLLERGADPASADAIYNGTPAGWAEHSGATGVSALLRS